MTTFLCNKPTNPFTDCKNVTLSLDISSSDTAICELSAPFTCSLSVYLAELVDSITVSFGENEADTGLKPAQNASTSTQIFVISHVFASEGVKDIIISGIAGTCRPQINATANVGAKPALANNGVAQASGVAILDSAFTLTVSITVPGTYTYQWYKNGVVITGATGITLNFSTLTAADSGSYYCVVGNTYGSYTSAPYVLVPEPATIAAQKVLFTVNITGNGSVVPASGEYPRDTTLLLAATPDSGWSFSGWSDSVSGFVSTVFLLMNSDKIASAAFLPDTAAHQKANLALTIIGNGFVTPPAGQYTKDTSITLTATADSGWEFSRWDGDASGSSPTYLLSMDADKSVESHFAQIIKYHILVSDSGGGTVSVSDTTIRSGQPLTITATPNSDCMFDRWGGDTTSTSPTITITVTRDMNITAYFPALPPNMHSLTASYTGQGSIQTLPTGNMHAKGTQVTLIATPAANWVFSNWSGDTTSTHLDTARVTMDTNKTVEGHFSLKTYQLTVNPNGGTLVKPSASASAVTVNVQHGVGTEIEAGNRTGYAFNGWSVTSGSATIANAAVQATSVTLESGNATVSAAWDAVFKMSYHGNGSISGSVPIDLSNYTQGSIAAVQGNVGNLSRPGYTFKSWSKDQAGTGKKYYASDTLVIGSLDVTLFANWIIDTFTVSFESNGGTLINSQRIIYNSFAAIPNPAPLKTGYEFGGWYISSGLSTEFDFSSTPIIASRVLYAKWIPHIYTITFNAGVTNGFRTPKSKHGRGRL